MGAGGDRELVVNEELDRELDPEASARMAAALLHIDRADAAFKQNREETRYSQNVKAWGRLCRVLDAHLRLMGNVFHEAHQLSLDIGVDGQGHAAKPWVEETGKKIPKMYLRLHEGKVQAISNNMLIAESEIADVTYEWVEACGVEWVVMSGEARAKTVPA